MLEDTNAILSLSFSSGSELLASGSANDFGDTVSPTASFGATGHACMQVHNWGNTQTVFALNRWGGNGNVVELGVGTDPNPARGSYSPDWTFATNAPTYVTKNLHILVLPYSDTNGWNPIRTGSYTSVDNVAGTSAAAWRTRTVTSWPVGALRSSVCSVSGPR